MGRLSCIIQVAPGDHKHPREREVGGSGSERGGVRMEAEVREERTCSGVALQMVERVTSQGRHALLEDRKGKEGTSLAFQ